MYKRSYISYIPFNILINYLESLKSTDKIEFYMVIEHFGEKGGKNHSHVYVESVLKNVDNIVSGYVCYDVNGALKTLFPNKSDLSNWYWYVLHNKEYLLKKGLKKEIEYSHDDICISDETYFLDNIKDLRYISPKNKYILECISSGESAVSLYKRGLVTLYEMRLLDMYEMRLLDMHKKEDLNYGK